MKKILLSLMFIGTVFFGKSQVVLNEVYTDPGAGKSEFIELYNTSVGNAPIGIDCYYLVVMYATGNGQLSNLERGFYVLDFPNVSIGPKGYLVGASTDPFNVQAKTNVDAAFEWNTFTNVTNGVTTNLTGGSLTKYKYNGIGYDIVSIPSGFNDLFSSMPSSVGVTFAFFLFNNGTYINGLIGGGGVTSTVVPTSITGLPSRTVSTSCGNQVINFSQLTKSEFSNSTPGSDNGYARKNDGACGTWDKTANNHTPGTSNGSATALSGSLTTANVFVCPSTVGDPALIRVNVTGATGDANADNTLPVEAQLYYDFTTVDQLDGNDVYKESKIFSSFVGSEQTFSIPYSDKNQPLLIAYKTVLGCFDKIVSLDQACIPLPVHFKSFTANRSNSSSVAITWTTASEDNSKGFNIQRNVGGVWTTIAYVPSQAINGSSTSELTYNYTDANSLKGITQYRIQQVDLDGKAKYSDIRAIRGDGAASKVVVYPNPSVDGKVNVVFEDNSSVRDVYVNDMQGRVVKSYKGITNNILVIERLTSGFYTIKITNRNTAASSVEKVVVK